MTPSLPDAVAALVTGDGVRVGQRAQAFPFLTVDEAGWPHVALLSAAELAVAPDGGLLAAMASPTTRRNLARSGQATLLAVAGTVAYTVKLRVRRTAEAEGLLGVALDVASSAADSVGVELSPIGYVPTEALGALEQWDRSARVLALLAAG